MKKRLTIINIAMWMLVFTGSIIFMNFEIHGRDNLVKEKTLAVKDVEAIVLQSDSTRVEFTITSAEQIRICQFGRASATQKELFTVDVASGSATIRLKHRFKLFDFWSPGEKLVIELPRSWFGDVEAKSASSEIKIVDSFAWRDVKLSCSSGTISMVEGLAAESISISVSSGGIKTGGELSVLGNVNIEITSGSINIGKPIQADDVFIRASSGGIIINKVNASNLTLTNVSGGIKLGETKADRFKLETASGGINANGITGEGSVKTSSGGIKITLRDPLQDVDISSKSGSIRISVDKSVHFKFNGESASGSIRANFPLQKDGGSKRSATIGDSPASTISATAASGGIRINRE